MNRPDMHQIHDDDAPTFGWAAFLIWAFLIAGGAWVALEIAALVWGRV